MSSKMEVIEKGAASVLTDDIPYKIRDVPNCICLDAISEQKYGQYYHEAIQNRPRSLRKKVRTRI